MIEWLALPGWQTPPTTLEEWVEHLEKAAGPVAVTRESTNVSWLEVGSLRLRGYVVLGGGHVEAINFEIGGQDPGPAEQALAVAAGTLRWELHPDDPDDSDTDPDDD